jgi:epoxyqueuosine reductase
VRPRDPAPPPAGQPYLDELLAQATELGLDRVGVAPATVLQRARTALYDRRDRGLNDTMQFTYRDPVRSTDPQIAVRNARSVLVAARSYAMAEPPRPPGSARVARYAWMDHYGPLREALRTIAKRMRADGHKAVAFADDNSMVDREIAWAAGLGWFGKNANLLLPGGGSYFVLGSIVTTAELPAAERVAPDGCGTCDVCFGACPTQAIVAPGVIDAGRCLAWVLQKPGIIPVAFRSAIGDRLYGCDDCQEACPPTVRLEVRHRRTGPAKAWVPVLDLLGASDDDLIEQHGEWYLSDRDPTWWRRNALVVLGNIGDAADPLVGVTLARYLAHDREELRAHAVWASARLGLHHLLPLTDAAPDVVTELDAARSSVPLR